MEYPLINGHRYSFASIEVSVGGRRIVGFREISYRVRREIGEVRGVHPEPLGYTRGEITYEATLVAYAEEAEELVRALGPGYMEQPFDITVTYAEEGQRTVTDQLLGCRITQIERDHSRGTDPLEVRFELKPARIRYWGLDPIRQPLQGVS